MSHISFRLLAAAAAFVIAASTFPADTVAESRSYRVERGPGLFSWLFPGARSHTRRTAVRGSVESVGGYSYTIPESLDMTVLPPAPQDFGPYIDQSPVAVDGPITQNPYP